MHLHQNDRPNLPLFYFLSPSGRDGAFKPGQAGRAAAGREGPQLSVAAPQGPGEGAGGAGDKGPGDGAAPQDQHRRPQPARASTGETAETRQAVYRGESLQIKVERLKGSLFMGS